MNTRPLFLLGLLGAVYLYARQRGALTYGSGTGGAALAPPANSSPETVTSILDTVSNYVEALTKGWQNPPPGLGPLFAAAEGSYGIPPGTLQKMGYLESHWRADIISGAQRSKFGAIGIMQFLPSTAASLGVNPLDPVSAIDGAGRYLRSLYNRFYDWDQAIASYNAGGGNVHHALTLYGDNWLKKLKPETQDYVAFATPEDRAFV